MTFVEAAVQILRREGKPLHIKELTRLAIKHNLLSVVGRDPEAMMETRLLIEAKRPSADLVRVSPGIFGLRVYPPRSERGEAVKAEGEKVTKPKAEATATPAKDRADRGASVVGLAVLPIAQRPRSRRIQPRWWHQPPRQVRRRLRAVTPLPQSKPSRQPPPNQPPSQLPPRADVGPETVQRIEVLCLPPQQQLQKARHRLRLQHPRWSRSQPRVSQLRHQ